MSARHLVTASWIADAVPTFPTAPSPVTTHCHHGQSLRLQARRFSADLERLGSWRRTRHEVNRLVDVDMLEECMEDD